MVASVNPTTKAELVDAEERLQIDKPIDLRLPWETALKQAKITDFRFHDLRHSAASYLAMNGASLAEIAEGDRLMEFLVFEAVYEGEFMGKQISGVPIKFNQVEMVRIDDGRIVEWWVEQDQLWKAQQLGMELVW